MVAVTEVDLDWSGVTWVDYRIHTGPAKYLCDQGAGHVCEEQDAPLSCLLVVIESPYAGDIASNVRYARAAVRDSLLRGEYPIASHLLYTQDGILDDGVPTDRELGIRAGLAWGEKAALTAVYYDLGISNGMREGINTALGAGRQVDFRKLKEWVAQ